MIRVASIIFLLAAVVLRLLGEDAYAGLPEDQKKAIKQAVDQVEHDMEDVKTLLPATQKPPDPISLTLGQATSQTADNVAAMVASDPQQAKEIAGLRAQIDAMTESQLGKDVVQEALSRRLASYGGGDPNGTMTYQSGPAGLLWIFWATDAPGTEQLPAQISSVIVKFPTMVIRDTHVFRLTDWHDALKYLSSVKDYLESHDPNLTKEEECARKREYVEANLKKYRALTVMSDARRRGGYLIVEDMTSALAYHVTELPTSVFLSPRGLVHRIHGLNATRNLADWITSCETWEDQNRAVLESRGVKW